MLILARKIGQSIVINNDIYITVLGMNGSQIRLGIEAPGAIPVHREEIQIKVENQSHNSMLHVRLPEHLTQTTAH